MKLRRSERRRGTPERGSELSAAELALIASCGGRIRKGDWALIESVGLKQAASSPSDASIRGRARDRTDSRSTAKLLSSLCLVAASAITSVVLWRRQRRPDDENEDG